METLKVLRTIDEVLVLIEYLKDKDFIAFDCETTGVSESSEIIGYSVCADPELAYYIVTAEWDFASQKLNYLETKEISTNFFSHLVDKSLIGHNAIFDCKMIERNYGVNLIQSIHTDTMILGHLLDENRSNGLKELGVSIFGEDADKEQKIMKESVAKNGGVLTKAKYELYKADSELIGLYGAKDTILTLKLFYHLVPQLYEEKLDAFFYEDESMPLLRGPMYDLNTTGLKVDTEALSKLRADIVSQCAELKSFIYKEISSIVSEEYPGTTKTNKFSITSNHQLSWLLYNKLGNVFTGLTDAGKDLCAGLGIKIPYSNADKHRFIAQIEERQGEIWEQASFNPKTKKMGRPKKIGKYWTYLSADKEALGVFAKKYKWVEKLLEHSKAEKILNTYVTGIQDKLEYGIIRPSFLQHGTLSGRFSGKSPNFQQLPRDDRRIKSCIVSRPGRVFIGADYSQLEPRIFASISQDPILLECFRSGKDFYSVVGMPIFGKTDCSEYKNDPNAFAKKYEDLRNISKQFALATPYGTGAFQQSRKLKLPVEECQDIIDRYFGAYPNVEQMMLDSHEQAKTTGRVQSLFGRVRRLPGALEIIPVYGDTKHGKLPSEARTLLNQAVNFRMQSAAASIVNRAAIKFYSYCKEIGSDAKLVMQIHDEVVVECREEEAQNIAALLKDAMENTTKLPGVDLIAEPKIGKNLATCK
jgi:DNA polymerase I-like protein with 3'-5' exonuclease and polymerase domains